MDITAPSHVSPQPVPSLARGLLRAITGLETFICFTSFIIGTIALAMDIFGREFLGFGIFGAQRLAVYCMAVAGVMGFSYVVSHGGHLRPTILDKLTPARHDRIAARVADVVSCLLCLLVAYGAFLFVHSTFVIGERDMTLPIYIWPVQSVLVVSFVFAAIKFLLFALFPALRPADKKGDI